MSGSLKYPGTSAKLHLRHYNDVIMSTMASQVTSLMIVYSIIYSRRRSKKASKPRVTGLCVGNSPVIGEFPAQRPVMRKVFPFDDVIVDSCARSRYKGQVETITSHNICGMYLIVPALDTFFWHTVPHFSFHIRPYFYIIHAMLHTALNICKYRLTSNKRGTKIRRIKRHSPHSNVKS